MSKCVSCEYALYDGMCLAQGKYTVLNADSCELYRPTQGHEVARLKRENAKLRELMADMRRYGMCECEHKDDCQTCEFAFPRRMRELGLEWGDFNV